MFAYLELSGLGEIGTYSTCVNMLSSFLSVSWVLSSCGACDETAVLAEGEEASFAVGSALFLLSFEPVPYMMSSSLSLPGEL